MTPSGGSHVCELASPAEPHLHRARAPPSLPPVVMLTYDATTEAVTVRVRPVYLDAKSSPIAGRFVFAYFVTVANDSPYEVQLLRRRWRIEDASGTVQDVEGEGVIGRQPVIPPGGRHEYHSFCVLPTFTGAMEGDYLLQREDGARFRAEIPRFHLAAGTN